MVFLIKFLGKQANKIFLYYVKSVKIQSVFWSVFSCIQTGYRKIRTRKNSVFGYFSHSAGYAFYFVTEISSYLFNSMNIYGITFTRDWKFGRPMRWKLFWLIVDCKTLQGSVWWLALYSDKTNLVSQKDYPVRFPFFVGMCHLRIFYRKCGFIGIRNSSSIHFRDINIWNNFKRWDLQLGTYHMHVRWILKGGIK